MEWFHQYKKLKGDKVTYIKIEGEVYFHMYRAEGRKGKEEEWVRKFFEAESIWESSLYKFPGGLSLSLMLDVQLRLLAYDLLKCPFQFYPKSLLSLLC